MRDAKIGSQLPLEPLDFRTEDELLTVADASDGGEDLGAQRLILRLEVQQLHRRPDRGGHRTTI